MQSDRTKHVGARSSTVLSLPFQLVFIGTTKRFNGAADA
jgi:hypothetical protein